jgi:hypothetical protein
MSVLIAAVVLASLFLAFVIVATLTLSANLG